MFTYNLQPFVAVAPKGPIAKSQISYLPDSDELDVLIVAARVAPREYREEMEPGALEYIIDAMRCTHATPWDAVEDEFDAIMERPGSSLAFVELLTYAEYLRLGGSDGQVDLSGAVRGMIDRMIAFLIREAQYRLDEYERELRWNREHTKEEQHEINIRPADVYRDFGPALRYATNTLGSFAARRMFKELALQTTMPFNELENPDWIDPYTGRGEKKYEQVRIRKLELSSDGNAEPETPAVLADLLEMLEQGGYEVYGGFHADGTHLDPKKERELAKPMDKKFEEDRAYEAWWDQFDDAQRGGFDAEADADDGNAQVDFHEINKDFEGKQEFETTEALDGFRSLYAKELADMRNILADYGQGLLILRRMPENVAWAEKWLRPIIRHSEPFVRMLKFVRAIAHEHEPQDLLALLLPFISEIGYSLEDLATVKIAGQCRDLDEWFRTYEDQFLDQFQDQAGQMGGEPTGDELDKFTDDEIQERVRVYLSPCGNEKFHHKLHELEKGKPKKGQTWKQYRAECLDKAWEEFWAEQKKSPIGHSCWVPNPAKKGRKMHDPLAMASFNKVFNPETMNCAEALKAFWSACADNQVDARYTPEFVQAEMMAAFMGDGSQGSAFKAGWAAWRNKIDPEANRSYLAAIREHKTPGEAMKIFWEQVQTHKNQIRGLVKQGIVLASGRVIDWGLARYKMQQGEIKLTPPEMDRLLQKLKETKFGPMLQAYLKAEVDKAYDQVNKILDENLRIK